MDDVFKLQPRDEVNEIDDIIFDDVMTKDDLSLMDDGELEDLDIFDADINEVEVVISDKDSVPRIHAIKYLLLCLVIGFLLGLGVGMIINL